MELEALGRPAVLAASGAFAQAAEAQAALLGQPGLRRVLVAHPVQDRTDDEVRALARDAADPPLAAVSQTPQRGTSQSRSAALNACGRSCMTQWPASGMSARERS